MNDTIQQQEYLTFLLNKEEYGVDILCVQEIRVWSPVTELPNTPDYVKGIINLRGAVVPIIDLRERFNQQASPYDATTVVIILRNQLNNQTDPSSAAASDDTFMIGLIVDAVSEVYKIDSRAMQKPPAFGSKIDLRFIKGIATIDEKMVILLNTNILLDAEQLFTTINETVTTG